MLLYTFGEIDKLKLSYVNYPDTPPGLITTSYVTRPKGVQNELQDRLERHICGNDGIYNIDSISDMPLLEFIKYYNLIAIIPRSCIEVN